MPGKKLTRIEHRVPNDPLMTPRSGSPSHGEAAQDMDAYVRPLQEMHAGDAHDWGVVSGLRVTATLNQPSVKVEPGVALDIQGRQISLALNGNAEIGTNDPPIPATPISATVGNFVIPTAGLSGTKYLTVRWWEAFDNSAVIQGIFQYNHTPWIRLVNTAGFVDDGSQIVLARVTLDGASNVTGVTHELRRNAGLPVEKIRFRKGRTASGAPNFAVDSTGSGAGNPDSAVMRPRADGGLEVQVANAGDHIEFERDGGNFAKMAIAAQEIVARRSDGRESVVIDTQLGNMTVGTNGVDGDVLVKDTNNRLTIALDGDSATIVIGAAGNEGDILVKDNAGQNSVRVDGNTGTVFTKRIGASQGDAVDVDARFLRIHGWDLVLDGRSGGNKRALVDLGNRLIVNFADDYANGVDINKLHLSDHIKVGFWETWDEFNPPHGQWTTFFEQDTGLLASEWASVSMCEIGMWDKGSVNNFWWETDNQSYTSAQGTIVIKWDVQIGDDGNDWIVWQRSVMWMAFRR